MDPSFDAMDDAASDRVDAKRLSAIPPKTEARQRLNTPLDKKFICYTGYLFEWNEVYTLATSAEYLSEDYTLYIVGGMRKMWRTYNGL